MSALGSIEFDCVVAGPLAARVRLDARVANYPLRKTLRMDCQVKPSRFVRVMFSARVANGDAAAASEASILLPTDQILLNGTQL